MAQEELNLLHLSAGSVAEAGTRPPQIVRSDSREPELGGVLLDNVPNDSLAHALAPGFSGSANAPKHPAPVDSRRHEPVVNGLLHPVGNRNGSDVPALFQPSPRWPSDLRVAGAGQRSVRRVHDAEDRSPAERGGVLDRACLSGFRFQEPARDSEIPPVSQFPSRTPSFCAPLTRRMPAASSGLSSPASAAS